MKPWQTDPQLSFCRHGRSGYDNQHCMRSVPLDFHVPFRIRDAFVDLSLRLGSVAIFEDAGCSCRDVRATDQMGKIFDATKNALAALADANVWVDLLVQSGELTNELDTPPMIL